MAGIEEEEDDYMSMAILEPEQPKFESSVQKRARQKKEAEERSHPKSKAERAAEEARAREDALAKKMDESSKGFKMLSKLGYKPGTALGAQNRVDARLEPIGIEMRENRSGIGLNTEKKRKFWEETESEVKRVKASEDDYRVRVAKEREDKRNEGLWRAAMAVLERIESEDGDEYDGSKGGDSERATHQSDETDTKHAAAIGVGSAKKASKPLPAINLMYRSLVRSRMLAERERRMRHDLNQSLSRNPNYADDTEKDDEPDDKEIVDDLECEDPELDEFEALEPAERLSKVLAYLRDVHHYCFWCKYRYPDASMEGCPGPSDEDHD